MPVDSLLPGILSTAGLTGATAPAVSAKDSPQKIHDSAEQFESLLVGQILKASHDEDGGWLGAGEDQTAGPAMQMADEYFAQSITAHGGLGLAKMISTSLTQAVSQKAASPNQASPEAASPEASSAASTRSNPAN